jgi:hypothetical protein
MTLDELDKLLDEALSPFIEKNEKEDKINEELNLKETPKKEGQTENKPQQIKVRFIKKINP